MSICGYKVIWNLIREVENSMYGNMDKTVSSRIQDYSGGENFLLILPRGIVEASYPDPRGKHIGSCTIHTTGLQQKIEEMMQITSRSKIQQCQLNTSSRRQIRKQCKQKKSY
jgi:hypothetical protein